MQQQVSPVRLTAHHSRLPEAKLLRTQTPYTPTLHSVVAKAVRLNALLHEIHQKEEWPNDGQPGLFGLLADGELTADDSENIQAPVGSVLPVDCLTREYEALEAEHAELKQFTRGSNRKGIGWDTPLQDSAKNVGSDCTFMGRSFRTYFTY